MEATIGLHRSMLTAHKVMASTFAPFADIWHVVYEQPDRKLVKLTFINQVCTTISPCSNGQEGWYWLVEQYNNR